MFISLLKYNHLCSSSWLSVAILGAIACACGDTWASEIGSAYGPGTARLITSGRVVPAGLSTKFISRFFML